jgi:tetratricopeptide (TPR) repeat protein
MSHSGGASSASQALAPLIGRDAELAVLARAYASVEADGTARIVTVVGETGVGKSRLVEALFERHADDASALRVYRARGRAQRSSYGILANLLNARFGVGDGADPERAVALVRAEVASVLGDRRVGDVCYFLGQLMGLPFSESPLTRAIADDAQQARPLLGTLLRQFFEADAARSPLCLIFEDLQQADADSVELVTQLVDHLRGPLLVICTGKQELLSRYDGWAARAPGRHDLCELLPVSQTEAAEIMKALLAPCVGGPPAELIRAGVRLAAGNPGLLGRMVRIFHDARVLRPRPEDGAWSVDFSRLSDVKLPLTVEDAVGLRVTALSQHHRRILEHAAAMGGVFWLGGLVALGRRELPAPALWKERETKDVGELSEHLDDLVRRDYLLKMPDSAFRGDTEYVFKHSLEREKIAALTSPAAAKRYHQIIADWLAQNENVRSEEEYAAMMASHLEQAGCLTRSAFTYIDAAQLARSHFAAKRAHEYCAKGLELLRDDDARRRIDALHNHGDVLLSLGRTDEALAAFHEMQGLAYRFNLKAKGGAAHNRIGRLYRDTGVLEEAQGHLETGLALFQAAKDERGVAASHDDLGKLSWLRGDYDAALEQLRTALKMRRQIGDRRSIAVSLNNIGLVWMDHGDPTRAKEALQASLEIRREIGDPLGVIASLNDLGRLARDQDDLDQALAYFQQAHEAANEIGERNRGAVVLINIGETEQLRGNSEGAIVTLRKARDLCEELGDRLHLAGAERALAKAYLEAGELGPAKESIKRAVELFGAVRSRAHLAIALRTLGEVTGAGAWGEGHRGKAVDYFMRSIAICKEIGNEIEVAKSYLAFSDYVTSSEHYQKNGDIQREAQKLSSMAREIFARHRIVTAEA